MWKQIESDLTSAIAGLPVAYARPATDLGRATKGAAIALLGKAYLYQKKYVEAATDTLGRICIRLARWQGRSHKN